LFGILQYTGCVTHLTVAAQSTAFQYPVCIITAEDLSASYINTRAYHIKRNPGTSLSQFIYCIHFIDYVILTDLIP